MKEVRHREARLSFKNCAKNKLIFTLSSRIVELSDIVFNLHTRIHTRTDCGQRRFPDTRHTCFIQRIIPLKTFPTQRGFVGQVCNQRRQIVKHCLVGLDKGGGGCLRFVVLLSIELNLDAFTMSQLDI